MYSNKIYPNSQVRNVMNDKCEMYKYFNNQKINIAPFECVVLGKSNSNRAFNNGVEKMMDAISNIGESVIAKPALGFMDLGIKKLSPDIDQVSDYVDMALYDKYDKVVIQEFVPSFLENLEMRNYYIGGRFQFAIFTNPDKSNVFRVFNKNEADQKGVGDLFNKGNELAEEVMKSASMLYYKKYLPGLIRIDIGCCLSTNQVFLNETELLPGMFFPWFDSEQNHKILRKLGMNYAAVISSSLNL